LTALVHSRLSYDADSSDNWWWSAKNFNFFYQQSHNFNRIDTDLEPSWKIKHLKGLAWPQPDYEFSSPSAPQRFGIPTRHPNCSEWNIKKPVRVQIAK
jgi:hypothetical protein